MSDEAYVDWSLALLSAVRDAVSDLDGDELSDKVVDALSHLNDEGNNIYDILFFNEKLAGMDDDERAEYMSETTSIFSGFLVCILLSGGCDKMGLSEQMRARIESYVHNERMHECLRFIYYYFSKKVTLDCGESDSMFKDGVSPEVLRSSLIKLSGDVDGFLTYCGGGVVGIADDELFSFGLRYVRENYEIIAMVENSLCRAGIYYRITIGDLDVMASMDRLCVDDFLAMHNDDLVTIIYNGTPRREHVKRLLSALLVCGEIHRGDTVLLVCYDKGCDGIRKLSRECDDVILAGFVPIVLRNCVSKKAFNNSSAKLKMVPNSRWLPKEPDVDVLYERMHIYNEAMLWVALMEMLGVQMMRDDETMRLHYGEYGNFVIEVFGYGVIETRDLSFFLHNYEFGIVNSYLDDVLPGDDERVRFLKGMKVLAAGLPSEVLEQIRQSMMKSFSPSSYISDRAKRIDASVEKCRKLLESIGWDCQLSLLADGVPADDIVA